MAPYPLVSPTEEDLELRMLEEELGCAACKTTASVCTPPAAKPPASSKLDAAGKPILAPRGKNWLGQAMLEMSDTRPPRRTWDFVAAFSLETLMVLVLLLFPLIYTEAIDVSQFTTTFLVAPPPPPPPPPPPAQNVFRASAPKRVFTASGRLLAPTAIPQNIAMLKEEALPPDVIGGVEGGVPGGVPGGQAGGVLGGILQDSSRNIPTLTAPPAIRKAPVRVGGNIKRPLAVYTPPPLYPALARQARIQGSVEVQAIIDMHGNIVEAQVVSGHPLLLKAALDTVRQWKYQPTILNGEPVAIELIVTVNFKLSD